MLDHIFLTVSDLTRSVSFYGTVLPIIVITDRHDHNESDGPAGYSDLKRFGTNGRIFFWPRQGNIAPGAVHVGFVANSKEQVHSAYDTALIVGAESEVTPGPQACYDPRYYAAQVIDPNGYSPEFVYKSWQHPA